MRTRASDQDSVLTSVDLTLYVLQVVLLVGASNSGEDISREISQVAHRVILSARTWTEAQELGPLSQPYGDRSNIYRCVCDQGSLQKCYGLRCIYRLCDQGALQGFDGFGSKHKGVELTKYGTKPQRSNHQGHLEWFCNGQVLCMHVNSLCILSLTQSLCT